jgi:predicted RND superfamily exporter protein
MIVFERLSSALKILANVCSLLQFVFLLLIGTAWNLGFIFYLSGGDLGAIAYILIIVGFAFAVHVYKTIAAFVSPERLSEFQSAKLTRKDLVDIFKD